MRKKRKLTYEELTDRAFILAVAALGLAFLSVMLSLG